jgi:selenide,water dikinase
MTDVTGFGLLGHLLEITRGSSLSAQLCFADIPVHPLALELVQAGFSPGASERNWTSYGHEVRLPAGMAEWQRKLLCDPQTSGGLMVACEADAIPTVLAEMSRNGFAHARVIGTLEQGSGVSVAY